MPLVSRLVSLLPGLALCVALALVARALHMLEVLAFGAGHVEALVLAILLGALLRAIWEPGPCFASGVGFAARPVLEVAIVLLGASISFAMIARSGPALLAAILGVVALTLASGYALGRMLGLSPRLSALIACGNAVCGNSAIAALAPAIRASAQEVASAISFTAILGVVVVLALPVLMPALAMSAQQYGVLAGLTVYAVPQVLAAAAAGGAAATQIGTLVKLIRVLTLGPIVLGAALLFRAREEPGEESGGTRPGLRRMLPWFIPGFLALAALRSAGLIPAPLVEAMATASGALTLVAMAALGLGVDLRALRSVGPRAATAVTLSLLVLTALALVAVRLSGVE